jgi:Flp pilus assembly CpaF family ATPase
MFNEIVSSKMSVRDIEEQIRNRKSSNKENRVSTTLETTLDKKTKNEIATLYQSDISISMSKEGSGKLSFKFDSPQDMERLVKLLLKK